MSLDFRFQAHLDMRWKYLQILAEPDGGPNSRNKQKNRNFIVCRTYHDVKLTQQAEFVRKCRKFDTYFEASIVFYSYRLHRSSPLNLMNGERCERCRRTVYYACIIHTALAQSSFIYKVYYIYKAQIRREQLASDSTHRSVND
jgi:hypothetical protein